MVKCPNCGNENGEGLKVCLHCGSDLPVTHESSKSQESTKSHESHKNIKKEVLTEKPKKSSHWLRNLIILLVLIFLVLIAIGAFASLSSNGNSTDQSGLSDSLYYLDFDGLFTVNFNENLPYIEYSGDSTCEKYWTFNGDAYIKAPELTIFYWLGDKNYDLRMLEEYNEPERDENLWVYTNNNKNDDISQNDDYLVVVSNSKEAVGFMGDDLDTLKDYANSVKFE